ncbi:MAG: GNAT family N-acetyltransferase, partial [Nitrospinae bacterium]|nr:GNAT family N-acetyltransferase [Nitrospinota bacterium]
MFVALGDAPGMIAGYYSLSAASFEKDEHPPALAKRLPRYPVPAAVLGRLAIDRERPGRGL